MKKNRLDKFYNDKLKNRQFEMKAPYWENMEQLIEDDEKNKRRGAWWWSGLLSALLLLLFGFGYFMIGNQKMETQALAEQKTVTNNQEANSIKEHSNLKNEETNTLDTEQNKTNTNGQTDLDLLGNKKIENANSLQKEEQSNLNFNTKTTKNIKLNSANTISPNSKNSTKENKTTERVYANQNLDSSKEENQQSSKQNIFQEPVKSPNIESSNPIPFEENTNLSENNSSKNADDEIIILENPESLLSETQKNESNEEMVESLANILDLLTWEDKEVNEDLLDTTPLNTKLKDPWQFGIAAQGFLFPANKEQQNLLGASIGLVGGYRFNQVLSLHADLLYTIASGEFEKSQTVEKIAYSFGKEIKTYQLIPNRLQFINLPLYLKLQLARNGLELGVNFSYLTVLQGQVSSNDGILEKGRINKDAFNSFHTDLMAGYYFRMNAKAEIGLRLHYTLGEIIKSDFEQNDGTQLKALNAFHVRLNARYFF